MDIFLSEKMRVCVHTHLYIYIIYIYLYIYFPYRSIAVAHICRYWLFSAVLSKQEPVLFFLLLYECTNACRIPHTYGCLCMFAAIYFFRVYYVELCLFSVFVYISVIYSTKYRILTVRLNYCWIVTAYEWKFPYKNIIINYEILHSLVYYSLNTFFCKIITRNFYTNVF